jgi:hypothetical protein
MLVLLHRIPAINANASPSFRQRLSIRNHSIGSAIIPSVLSHDTAMEPSVGRA